MNFAVFIAFVLSKEKEYIFDNSSLLGINKHKIPVANNIQAHLYEDIFIESSLGILLDDITSFSIRFSELSNFSVLVANPNFRLNAKNKNNSLFGRKRRKSS